MDEQIAAKFVSLARQVAEDEASWADWHNRVFGHDGEFQKLFPTEEERREFVESPYFAQVERIQDAVREGYSIADYTVPITSGSGKFVVRIPRSLHEALAVEAKREGVSLNQLVQSKLAVSLRAATKQILAENNTICCN